MKSPAPLQDRWLFYYVYPVVASAVVHIGNENSLAYLLRIPSYYSDVLLAFALTYGVGYFYHRYYRVHPTRPVRSSEHLRHWGAVMLLPVAAVIGLELLYVTLLLDIPLRELSVFYLELPLVILFCVLINLIYAGVILPREEIKAAESAAILPGGFVVHVGARSIRVPVEDIAFFEVVEKMTFLVTAGGQRHLIDQPLREVQASTDPRQFFGLNRQVVANRRAIAGYVRTDTRKLAVDLEPAPEATPTVSKVKAGAFLRWLEEKELV